MKVLSFLPLFVFIYSWTSAQETFYTPDTKLSFEELATTWDEAIPLGNGMLGSLVWKKGNKLRFSLDRADLWDLRPMANIDFEKWTFQDVYEHWKADEYKEVQEAFDVPYNQLAGPSKIPCGALEFDVDQLGSVKSVVLHTGTALCTVTWENGTVLQTFVEADAPAGWYRFTNLPESIDLHLIPPAYNTQGDGTRPDQAMADLNKLGYPQGAVREQTHSLTYNQSGWSGFTYQIHTRWMPTTDGLTGC